MVSGKRANFSQIQASSWVNSVGLKVLPCQTSYGYILAHRVGKQFAFPSKQDGVVTESEEGKYLTVEYVDGSKDSVALGKVFGNDAGKTIPHELITDRMKGYKFKAGEILAWNKMFFTRDWLEPKQVNTLTGTPAVVIMKENLDTYEDGSTISARLASKLASKTTKLKDINCAYEDVVNLQVKVGDHVKKDSILCTIEPSTVGDSVSTHNSLEALGTISHATPKAGYTGVVEKIEVFYCGSDTMSSSLKKIVTADNKRRSELATRGLSHPTGEVKKPTYLGTNYLGPNTVIINVYISHDELMGAGDKTVFANQTKSVPGKVFTGLYQTEHGEDVDSEFSYAGVLNRIVESPKYMGVGNMILRKIGLNACKLSRGKSLE